jgi:hydroxypyruvate reductase
VRTAAVARIRNRRELATDDRRAAALDALAAGVAAADPARAVRETVTVEGTAVRVGDATIDLADVERVLVLGGGKPAGRMARALVAALPAARSVEGVVVATEAVDAAPVDVVVGGHPLPDEAGRAGAERILSAARAADEGTLVFAVVGGGGSALLPAPAGDLTLSALRATTESLLDTGAEIHDINAVRKHTSALKGGRLAVAAAPASVHALVASDVVGDDLATVASGPTVPDQTTYDDALAAVERAGTDVPDCVRAHLRAGAEGLHDADRTVPAETPTADHPAFEGVSNHIVLTNRRAVDAATERAAAAGDDPLVLTTRLRGEAGAVGRTLAGVVEEVRASGDPVAPPAAVVAGGETTVTVAGDGSGGPNAELVLSAALSCDAEAWTLAAVDTDGRDGGTDVAGAVVDAGTVADADDRRAARAALSANDAHGYLRDRAALVETGPTGTNVNDLVVALVD